MTHTRNDGNTVDKDLARTPVFLFSRLDKRFGFILDACCTRENCLTERGIFHDEGWDALKEDWYKQSFGKPIYCNPPYSNPEPFIEKAAKESLKGVTVVMLLPADTSTIAFNRYILGYDYDKNGTPIPNEFGASEVIFIKGRVRFNNPDGTPKKGSPKFGSMVVVFKQEEFDGSPVISSIGWR